MNQAGSAEPGTVLACPWSMKRFAVSALLLVLPACSDGAGDLAGAPALGAADDEIGIDVSSSDHVDLAQCGTESKAPDLVRCGDARALSNAATVCGALVANDALTVKSGPVVVGGDSRITGFIQVEGGSFTSYGGIEGDGRETIDGDLTTSSNWVVGAPAVIGGQAFVGGRLEAQSPVVIGGTLHVAGPVSGSVRSARTTKTGSDEPRAFSCAGAPQVQAIADATERLGVLDEDEALADVSHPKQMTLGCGRYRFASFDVGAPLSVRIAGNAVIIVDGDVKIAAPTHFDVVPGASLDVVVRGALSVEDTLSFYGGSTWLAAGGDIRVASPLRLAGFIVAPAGAIAESARLDVNGALYAGALTAESPVTVTATATALYACSGP